MHNGIQDMLLVLTNYGGYCGKPRPTFLPFADKDPLPGLVLSPGKRERGLLKVAAWSRALNRAPPSGVRGIQIHPGVLNERTKGQLYESY